MPYLSPPTLTQAEQRALLAATAGHLRDHLIFSVALGTGLRFGGGPAGDVFLPNALVGKLRRLWATRRPAG